jgi:hypothetical protein
LDSRETAPALAVAVLALMIPLQLALPSRTPLPEDPGLAPRRPHPLQVRPAPDDPKLAAAGLFSPDRAGAGGGGAGAPAALDEVQAVGVIMLGAAPTAVIKPVSGDQQLIHVGKTVAGWRLARIERDALVFQRGKESRRVVVGAPLAVKAPPSGQPAAKDADSDGSDS